MTSDEIVSKLADETFHGSRVWARVGNSEDCFVTDCRMGVRAYCYPYRLYMCPPGLANLGPPKTPPLVTIVAHPRILSSLYEAVLAAVEPLVLPDWVEESIA